MSREERSNLVYSTDAPSKGKAKPAAPEKKKCTMGKGPSSGQKLHLRLERKGRGGKTVTLICGLGLPEPRMEALLKTLKTRLGTGGALKEDILEIQGDHREAVRAALLEAGFRIG